MEIISNSVNVEEIMKEIRDEIDKKGYRKAPLSFEDIPIGLGVSDGPFHMARMEECRNLLNNQFSVITYRVLEPGPRKFGKLIVFMKKVVRKLVRFYVDPVVEQQNRFNFTVAEFSNEVTKFISENNAQPDAREQLDLLKEIRLLRQENEELKKGLEQLQTQVNNLNDRR